MLNVLLTNDDGIEAEGLRAMRDALAALPDVRLAVIAPDGNRSAMARSITTRRPLWVEEVEFPDGSPGYATDGTPVDCVRLARLGVVEGFDADVVVSGINHGANLGDDITYSGTVAAALEGVVLGLPAIAVSQQSGARALDYRFHGGFNFDVAAGFVARLVERLESLPLPPNTLLNVNVPAGRPDGVEVARLGKRIYRDELKLEREESRTPGAAALLDLRRRSRLPRRARHRPRRGGGRPHRRHTHALRPHLPSGHRGAGRLRPERPARRRRGGGRLTAVRGRSRRLVGGRRGS